MHGQRLVRDEVEGLHRAACSLAVQVCFTLLFLLARLELSVDDIQYVIMITSMIDKLMEDFPKVFLFYFCVIKHLNRIKIKCLVYLFLSSTFILFICPLVTFLLNPNQVEMHTLEMAPEGPVLLELTNQSSRSVRARWTAPPSPNGNLSYTLYYRSKGDVLSLFPTRKNISSNVNGHCSQYFCKYCLNQSIEEKDTL